MVNVSSRHEVRNDESQVESPETAQGEHEDLNNYLQSYFKNTRMRSNSFDDAQRVDNIPSKREYKKLYKQSIKAQSSYLELEIGEIKIDKIQETGENSSSINSPCCGESNYESQNHD